MTDIEQVKTDKFSFYVFRDIFNDKELQSILQEALFFCDRNKLKGPYETKSATNNDGTFKKNNKGKWVDNIYFYNYLKLYKKPLKELYRYDNDYTLNLYHHCNKESTLMSYYQDGDYYQSHYDLCAYTYIFWVFQEPKSFSGGDFTFDDVDYKLQVSSNMSVLFPSWANHSVDKVSMLSEDKPFSGLGRFAFSTFFKFT